jgi:adenosine deaminase
MYRYLSQKYPSVNKALHAGELALGQVPPEELTWHIRSAINIAGAGRIGHGVDLPYERDWPQLLDTMRRLGVAVEINLSSNDFILGIEKDEHPLPLYHRAGVPMVISTDDAGILRSNLTEQYVRLARDYPGIGYSDVKRFVYNSIEYSFLEDPSLKKSLKRHLDEDFDAFEKKMKNWILGAY